MSALFDAVISNCSVIVLRQDGCPVEEIPADVDLYLNGRRLCSSDGIDKLCQLYEDGVIDFQRVRGMDVSGANMSDSLALLLVSRIISKMTNLVELNMSYIPLSHKTVPALCAMIDVSISGYCSLKRLSLSRTSLDLKNCKSILDACKGNIELEQLVMSGNKYLRLASDTISRMLFDPENRFVSLNLGNCALDLTVLKAICPPLGRHPFLRELHLNSNSFGDEGVEILLSSVASGNIAQLENISLEKCNLVSCYWARHLPGLHTLHTLGLSYNSINDGGLQDLCRHIEKCFNLRNLSLASNAFGEKSMCLGSLLISNPGIIHLNVSGNKLHSESIDAIAFGIANNSTMLRLDLSSCVLSVENAVKVCHPLLTNQLIILDLSQNPVESNFQADPRAYVTQNQHIFIQDNTPGPFESQEIQDYARVSFDALSRHEIWRAEQEQFFAEVKMADQIVKEVSGRGKEDVMDVDTAVEQPSGSTVEIFQRPNEGEDAVLETSTVQIGSIVQSRASIAMRANASSTTGTSNANVGRRRLKEMKEEEFVVITVSYGPKSEVIGTIRVSGSASYANVRPLIHPLVALYFDRLRVPAEEISPDEKIFEDQRDMTDAFRMVDPNGVVVDREAEGSRVLLTELYGSADPTSIVVRPITWLQIPEADDADEADQFY